MEVLGKGASWSYLNSGHQKRLGAAIECWSRILGIVIVAMAACMTIDAQGIELDWSHEAANGIGTALRTSQDVVFGADGTFGRIADAATNSKSELLVLDRGFVCVHRFAENGDYLGQFGSEGDGPGDLRNPMAIAVGPDDAVYAAGSGALVAIYSPQGIPAGSFKRTKDTLSSRVLSIAVDYDGNVYICAVDVLHQKVITKYAAGTFAAIAQFGDTYAVGQDVDTRAERTFGGGFVRFGGAGELIYAQYAPPNVRRYTVDGALLAVPEIRGKDAELPRYSVDEERVTFFRLDIFSGRAVFVGSNEYLTCVAINEQPEGGDNDGDGRVFLDLYNISGAEVATCTMPWKTSLLCSDLAGRIYVGEHRSVGDEELPVVVRYILDR